MFFAEIMQFVPSMAVWGQTKNRPLFLGTTIVRAFVVLVVQASRLLFWYSAGGTPALHRKIRKTI